MSLKENKKVPVIILAICLLALLCIGLSYAWWRYTAIQDKTNVGISKCLKLELTNQSDEINLTNMYPITDEEGRKLTPYTFTLTNTCTMSAEYTLNMEMLEGTTLNSKYLAVMVNNGNINLLSSYDTATTEIDGSTESRTIDTGILMPNGSKDYSISLWMDKSVTLADDAQNKTFKSKVVVNAVAIELTPMQKIIAQLDTTGKCPTINSDGTVNVTGIEATDGYVCSASDAYGTSYYYRGNVTNNYVKFGNWSTELVYGYLTEASSDYLEYDSLKACQNSGSYNRKCTVIREKNAPMYWRIIRINGDGTVRVIYDGTSAHTNGESSADRQIGKSAFNYYWKRDNAHDSNNVYVAYDNAGIGYMYGNADTIVKTASPIVIADFANTSTYYIAKDYTFDESTRKFTLKNPIAVLGSAITSDYMGYYTMKSTSSDTSRGYVYNIFSITAGDSSVSAELSDVLYGTSSKEIAQTNTNDSTIKTYLDDWYKTNISGTENEQYLSDNIFCNDRSFASNNSGTGAGLSSTRYNWGSWHASKSNLKCSQQNDAFTVSDTTNGNGALTYPIGLLSTDEIVLAGGWSDGNSGYYLYSGQYWWASSPYFVNTHNALMRNVGGSGNASSWNYTDIAGGVRPVLNLKAAALAEGSGTATDSYRISLNS